METPPVLSQRHSQPSRIPVASLSFIVGPLSCSPAAWLIWRSAYFTKLGSLKNRLQVPWEWLKTLLFGRDLTTF